MFIQAKVPNAIVQAGRLAAPKFNFAAPNFSAWQLKKCVCENVLRNHAPPAPEFRSRNVLPELLGDLLKPCIEVSLSYRGTLFARPGTKSAAEGSTLEIFCTFLLAHLFNSTNYPD